MRERWRLDASPKAECPVCGDTRPLNLDGTIRKHRRFEIGGIYGYSGWVPCAGSGKKAPA